MKSAKENYDNLKVQIPNKVGETLSKTEKVRPKAKPRLDSTTTGLSSPRLSVTHCRTQRRHSTVSLSGWTRDTHDGKPAKKICKAPVKRPVTRIASSRTGTAIQACKKLGEVPECSVSHAAQCKEGSCASSHVCDDTVETFEDFQQQVLKVLKHEGESQCQEHRGSKILKTGKNNLADFKQDTLPDRILRPRRRTSYNLRRKVSDNMEKKWLNNDYLDNLVQNNEFYPNSQRTYPEEIPEKWRKQSPTPLKYRPQFPDRTGSALLESSNSVAPAYSEFQHFYKDCEYLTGENAHHHEECWNTPIRIHSGEPSQSIQYSNSVGETELNIVQQSLCGKNLNERDENKKNIKKKYLGGMLFFLIIIFFILLVFYCQSVLTMENDNFARKNNGYYSQYH
nr:PREDICTED: uncharacterized protein LOC107078592 [Lepisosteus oculatus]